MILSVTLLQLTVAHSQEGYIVLPTTAVKGQLPLCSRSGPTFETTWLPNDEEIAGLEKNLQAISQLPSRDPQWKKVRPEKSYRQYLGLVIAKHRYIYINAAYDIHPVKFRSKFIEICDGGAGVWGALYDPSTGKFSDLQTNGYA